MSPSRWPRSPSHGKRSGDFAAHRRTTAAATACASMRRRWSCVQGQPPGGVRSNAKENGQISRSTTVGAAQGDGSRPRRPPVLPERRKSAKIHAASRVIRGIPVNPVIRGRKAHVRKLFHRMDGWIERRLRSVCRQEMAKHGVATISASTAGAGIRARAADLSGA